MNKQYFIELAGFNVWANDIVCSWLEKISDEQWTQTVVSSFNSIQETTLHIISAEKAWAERFQGAEKIEWLQHTYKGSKQEHIGLWKKASADLKNFIADFDENRLQTNLDFRRLNGDFYSMPFYQLFAHVVNHSTYHRGQLVTMLRQVGFTDVGATDLLGFYRNK